MKKFILLFTILCISSLCFSQIETSNIKNLVFLTQDFRPFSYCDENKKVLGPIVEIIEAVCKEAGFNVEFKLYPWPRALKQAELGNAHGLFVLGWNEPRTKWLYFSEPITNTEYGFFFHKSNNKKFSSIQDLRNYKIAVYGPSNTSSKLEAIQKEVSGLEIDMHPDDYSGFKKLEIKRVDAVYSNKDVGNDIVKRNDIKNIVYAGKNQDLKYYIGFVKKVVPKDEFEKFNNAYKKLYSNGDIEVILEKYSLTPPK